MRSCVRSRYLKGQNSISYSRMRIDISSYVKRRASFCLSFLHRGNFSDEHASITFEAMEQSCRRQLAINDTIDACTVFSSFFRSISSSVISTSTRADSRNAIATRSTVQTAIRVRVTDVNAKDTLVPSPLVHAPGFLREDFPFAVNIPKFIERPVSRFAFRKRLRGLLSCGIRLRVSPLARK